MAEVEVNTDWIAHDPVELSTGLGLGHDRVETGRLTQPMWYDDGAGGLAQGSPISSSPDVTLERLLDTTSSLAPSAPNERLWRMETDNNYAALFDPSAFQSYHARGMVDVGTVAVVDNDGTNWQAAREQQIAAQLYAEVPGALSPRITWDVAPGDYFGSHSNRRLIVTTQNFEDVYLIFAPNVIEGPFQYGQLETLVRVPPGVPKAGDTYAQAVGYESVTTSMDYHFSLREVLNSTPLTAGRAGDLLVCPVPDEMFEAEAAVLADARGTTRKTRAMLTWLMPDVLSLWDRQRQMQYEYTAPGDETGFRTYVVSTFQPPRYRIKYWVEVPDTAPIRRTFPRDDGLAGGAPRTFPQSRALQSSNRIGGGYL